MISIAKTVITKMANQLLLHSVGAKKPRMNSIPPKMANRNVKEILYASFRCEDETAQRTIPFSRITAVFIQTLVG